MNDIQKRLNNLSPEKRELLVKKLQAHKGTSLTEKANKIPSIQPVSRNQPIPLSFAQQRLWLLEQLEPDSAAYNILGGVCFTGQLNVSALQQSFSEIIRRHEVLRTNFITLDGQPIQIIHPTCSFSMTIVDWQNLSITEREISIQQLATAEAKRPFDLAKEPLVRVSLIKLEQTEHILMFCMHHIVSDGWSMGVFVQELVTLYSMFCNQQPSLRNVTRTPLAELSVQYADFAVWQRHWLQGEILESHLAYWRQQLAGAPALLELPTDRPRPAVQTFQGARQSFTLSSELTQALNSLSLREGVTLFMTLLAAFDTLLYRYTGQVDILVGSPIANRNHSGIEGLIGFFVNTLVIRTDISGNPTFSELLGRVREVTMDAYVHQDLPFELLVDTLQPQRDLSYTPLFQVMFVLQNAPMPEMEIPGLSLSALAIDNKTAKYDLILTFENTAQGLVGSWDYNTDLFDGSTIERMTAHFQNLCSAIASNPQQKIFELPVLSAAERQQLLFEWNDTQREYPKDKCIHQLFEEQVEKTPHAVAVVFEEQEFTYRQLNERANCLAHYLQTLGVGSEVLVGICVERSLEMVVGLLGILKAGGAYVPLDPNYPIERLSYMLDDAQVAILLTQDSLSSSVPSQTAWTVCLDTDWEVIEQHSQENLATSVSADNLAYVIYTSGSTGTPKGVYTAHRSVVRLLHNTDYADFNSEQIFLQLAPITFDASTLELWGSLLHGSKLVIFPSQALDLALLVQILHQHQITFLWLTAGLFHLIVEEYLDALSSVQQLLAGGDILSVAHVLRFQQRHPYCRLINGYGPTENTTFTCCYTLVEEQDIQQTVPIGKPIANTQVYILDQYMQPVPIGVAGELYVGGDGLARGYLNRPELTLEKFIPNPFSFEKSARLYKTGDLARYLPNGNIEFLGRLDEQVKIRGFRIELGEIEAVLSTHPQIQQAVVIAIADNSENKRLVAYVVSNQKTLSTNQIQDFLQQQLPAYMLPSVFVILDTLPLTPNGKVDRKALREIDSQNSESNANFVAPRTLEEELLVQIWSEVLGVEQVGIYDNFFALGGDSLRAVQVLAKADKSGLKLSLKQIFNHQTIYDLVGVTQQSDLSPSILKTAPFSLISSEERQSLPNEIEDAYPLTRLQLGMLFHSEYAPETAVYHDVFSYYLQAPLNIQILHSAIKEIVTRHPVLRTSIAMNQFSQPLQLVHSQVSIELPVDDLSCLPLDEQESNITTWIGQEKQRSFSWDTPPLARFHIHQRSCDTFNLSFSFHHAILDGWSLATLMTELVQHYFFLLGETTPPLRTVPSLTFRDYVALEQETLQSKECQRYWHEKLADFTATKLPRLLNSQQHSSVEQVGKQAVEISPALSAQLKQFAIKVGVPLKSVLLAAHLRVMSFLSNEADITTGVVTHGRPAAEDSERVLGLFLNTIPFRMQLNGGTWVELVEQTFENEREALPFQKYPLAQLQQKVGLGQPLFETMFNYVNFHVYQGLSGIDNLEVLGGQSFEQNNFTFAAQFPVNPITGEISLNLTYDPSQFSFEQVKSISGYYLKIFEAMVTQPEEQYKQVCLLSATERQQLLMEWNDTQREYPKDKCIHQLFEEQVKRTPDAIAVIFEQQELTYRQLNDRANCLAHYLQTLGVEPEVLVGICVERSIEMVVGLLGILKAGGAYVPLDPSYPQERLSYMLADSGVEVLLTHRPLLSSLPSPTAQVVCLDSDWGAIEQHQKKNLDVGVGADNLAYVIYTSGSTGLPKGVQICHHSVVNFLNSMSYFPGLTQEDTFNAVTTISFDIAGLELYLPLMVGAKVIVVPREIATDADLLLSKLFESKTTAMQATPATWQMLLAGGWSSNYPLKVFCGGEALSAQLAHQILETGSELWNLYGPTEATIWSAIYQVGANKTVSRNENAPSAIGRPISNTQIYILDSHLKLVSIGVPGELYIGGDGLARGYLNRPELTQEKFIANPFSQKEGARLYKTGDLARYLDDGNIEYLGRIDNQVKIRGFRIELGEIEAVLTKHPQVQEAVVIAREDEPSDKRLVAYFVPKKQQVPTNSELRCFLQEKLPNYMLPSHFVLLESLPLTPNGKVNRHALPAPEGLRPDLDIAYAMPQNKLEQTIATVWQKALNLEKVGIYDNFFELGGHSLLIIQIYSQLREILQTDFPMIEFLRYPTISSLAEYFNQTNNQKTFSNQTEIQAEKLKTGKARLKQRREQIQ
ncbi:Non-ribosomal peptide synthetase component F (plasmid) [Nostoc flagelliforme CCNUN1]|uniref:Non-ribosomal peptide synthetase component F n=1 Tax=Nostoc flagelliforme CCNUN1 TaxID=2038116 RepID=A0A2K8T880_9NOSO|nr:non-ribosomal peptide synthetase [Nostoc flagelliforme]AUB43295.1 Non-ribosomal peptide synthetase component F [Nostoc flagelliforme CCNUN1]